MNSIYNIEFLDKSNKARTLKEYEGKVILIVNTASKCGFTPQFEALEKLYLEYKDKGLVIIGFPCDQFNNQEFSSTKEALDFCKLNYGVTFPMMKKLDVNGDDAAPLYKYLKKEKKGILGTKAIKWNFTKFLIDSNGNVIERFAPKTIGKDIEDKIRNLI